MVEKIELALISGNIGPSLHLVETEAIDLVNRLASEGVTASVVKMKTGMDTTISVMVTLAPFFEVTKPNAEPEIKLDTTANPARVHLYFADPNTDMDAFIRRFSRLNAKRCGGIVEFELDNLRNSRIHILTQSREDEFRIYKTETSDVLIDALRMSGICMDVSMFNGSYFIKF